MKILKTFKQVYRLTKYDTINIDNKYYTIPTVYQLFVNITNIVFLMLLSPFAFIFGLGILDFEYPILNITIGFLCLFLLMYVIGFIFIFFAPLKEVEKPTKEMKKKSFFEKYKQYKLKSLEENK